MKLKHLTLVFLIIYLSLFCTGLIRRDVAEKSRIESERLAGACREGAAAAAGLLPAFLEEEDTPILRENLARAVEEGFYTGAGANLGIENVYGYRERLFSLVPVLCILREQDYIFFDMKVEAGQVKREIFGPYPYGVKAGGAPASLTQDRETCIEAVETALSREIGRVAAIRPVNGAVHVDLPEYTLDDSVLVISGPAVLVAAFGAGERGGFQVKVFGAEIRPAKLYTGITKNGRKEVHDENCRKLEEYLREGTAKKRSFDSYDAAAAEGFYPAECCDPLGVYLLDSLYPDGGGR
ncbi:MAG: hypothetical protein J6U10_07390 [Lachnospiraceae bacterium]|nr:hypothetical protein [Lachnospiraceae bacterium]